MNRSLALDQRALILAPAARADHTCQLLQQAGFGCAVSLDMDQLGEWLIEGAAMAIVDEHSLSGLNDCALEKFVEAQPEWSDLPVLLLCAPQSSSTWSQFGNLMPLSHPCADVQLLGLVQAALRGRQRQYGARDRALAAEQALRVQLALAREHQETLHQTRKMDAVGQLAGGIAHDFNNLLTSIGGSLELADRRLQRGQTDGLPSVLEMGRQAVNRAARLTHRLLAFSSRQSLHTQGVDVTELLRGPLLGRDVPAHIVLQRDVALDLWWARSDAAQLVESLDNLIVNACEAMPCGGTIQLRAANRQFDQAQFAGRLPAGDYVCISVSDEGQGMTSSTLEHAFEPFFSTKPTGQAIGLGLSMVYGFGRQSDGHVTLNSVIGQGTEVAVYLPRHPTPTDETSPRPSQPCGKTAQPARVLIVEDDEPIRTLLEQTLLEEGLECQVAADAEQALALMRASAQEVDLLVSDVGLPGMNGRQLAEIARTLQPRLQVLFITGFAQTAMAREQFLDAGMELLCKPFAMQRLREQVVNMLERRGAG